MDRYDSNGLWRVVTPTAVYGVVVRYGVVIQAAPIARRVVGMTLAQLTGYVRARRGGLQWVSR